MSRYTAGPQADAIRLPTATANVNTSTNSVSYVTTGLTITVPTTSGRTYTVVCLMPAVGSNTAGQPGSYEIHGSTLGDSADAFLANNAISASGGVPGTVQIARSGFSPGEVCTLKMRATSGYLVYAKGACSLLCYEEVS